MADELGEFIARRRHELGLSRDAVSSRAKRAGFALSASYVAKLEAGVNPNTGRPPRPTLEKIDALAAGLGLLREDLLGIIDGNGASKPRKGLSLDLQVPQDARQVPTEWELDLLRKISVIDWGQADPRKDPRFWYLDRAARRRILRNLEDVLFEIRALFGLKETHS